MLPGYQQLIFQVFPVGLKKYIVFFYLMTFPDIKNIYRAIDFCSDCGAVHRLNRSVSAYFPGKQTFFQLSGLNF